MHIDNSIAFASICTVFVLIFEFLDRGTQTTVNFYLQNKYDVNKTHWVSMLNSLDSRYMVVLLSMS